MPSSAVVSSVATCRTALPHCSGGRAFLLVLCSGQVWPFHHARHVLNVPSAAGTCAVLEGDPEPVITRDHPPGRGNKMWRKRLPYTYRAWWKGQACPLGNTCRYARPPERWRKPLQNMLHRAHDRVSRHQRAEIAARCTALCVESSPCLVTSLHL